MSKPLSGRALAFDLPVIPPVAGETRQAWVYRQLRENILRGALATGARLPSSRALAQRLQVSRSTIEVAFDQLRAEGYVAGVVGSGTYVSATLPDRFLAPARDAQAVRAPRPVAASATARAGRHGTAFVARVADAALFPVDEWRRHLQAAARTTGALIADEDDAFGALALRVQVARYLGAARGISCDAAQVVIVSGIRHGLGLCGRVLLRAADKVLLEDPGYMHAADIFAPFTRRIAHVPIDEAGFQVTRARRHAAVKLAYVTPAHQSPTGLTMPVTRRLELLAWARECGAWVVEDDYDSEFNYRSAPLPALKSLDDADRVIHCGSFNKTMFASLCIGYLVVPRALVPAFADACRVGGRGVGHIEQTALAAFIASGGLARHVRRSRAVYAQRRARVLAALADAVAPAELRTTGEHGGFHFAWWLPADVPLATLLAEAAARGLQLEDLAERCHGAKLPPAVLMGDAAIADDDLDVALAQLKAAIAAARR